MACRYRQHDVFGYFDHTGSWRLWGCGEALAEVPREKGLYISYTREQTGSVFTSVNTFVWRFRFERAYVP